MDQSSIEKLFPTARQNCLWVLIVPKKYLGAMIWCARRQIAALVVWYHAHAHCWYQRMPCFLFFLLEFLSMPLFSMYYMGTMCIPCCSSTFSLLEPHQIAIIGKKEPQKEATLCTPIELNVYS